MHFLYTHCVPGTSLSNCKTVIIPSSLCLFSKSKTLQRTYFNSSSFFIAFNETHFWESGRWIQRLGFFIITVLQMTFSVVSKYNCTVYFFLQEFSKGQFASMPSASWVLPLSYLNVSNLLTNYFTIILCIIAASQLLRHFCSRPNFCRSPLYHSDCLHYIHCFSRGFVYTISKHGLRFTHDP